MTKIINCETNQTIIEDSDLLIKELAEKAVKNKISLAYADLYFADLKGADLRWANFEGAYFEGTDLEDADLRGAKFKGADFRGAYLGGVKINKNQMRDLLEALGVKII